MPEKKKKKKNEHEYLAVLSLALFVTLVGIAVIGSLFILPKMSPPKPGATKPLSVTIDKMPATSIAGKGDIHEGSSAERRGSDTDRLEDTMMMRSGRSNARVAIIIDDVGVNKYPVRKLLELDVPITFSILPGQTHSRDIAEEIHNAGHEIMLHLPMEPVEGNGENIDKETLLLSHSPEELRNLARELTNSIPYAAGANNHMGSLLTQNSGSMRIIMEEIKGAHLYFIDSLTTPWSIAQSTARETGIKSAGRDIFIDDDRNEENIRKALFQAIRHAKRRGSTIAIGHPYSVTIKVLGEMKDEFKKAGVKLVYASELVR